MLYNKVIYIYVNIYKQYIYISLSCFECVDPASDIIQCTCDVYECILYTMDILYISIYTNIHVVYILPSFLRANDGGAV